MMIRQIYTEGEGLGRSCDHLLLGKEATMAERGPWPGPTDSEDTENQGPGVNSPE